MLFYSKLIGDEIVNLFFFHQIQIGQRFRHLRFQLWLTDQRKPAVYCNIYNQLIVLNKAELKVKRTF